MHETHSDTRLRKLLDDAPVSDNEVSLLMAITTMDLFGMIQYDNYVGLFGLVGIRLLMVWVWFCVLIQGLGRFLLWLSRRERTRMGHGVHGEEEGPIDR
jgi:hypothetical protein